MTYNIRKGLGASGKGKLALDLAKALAQLSPDLLLCQEVFCSTGDAPQCETIGSALGFPSHYRANKHRRVGHHGNASFSRFPVSSVQNFDVSTNAFERRGALYTRIEHERGPLHVFNVHLGLTERQRLTQIEQIGRLMNRLSHEKEPVLIAGDFNDWNARVDAYVTGTLGLKNAFALKPMKEIRTWHARRPVFNLDRVYVRGFEVEAAECLAGDPWTVLSDHLPLKVTLAL